MKPGIRREWTNSSVLALAKGSDPVEVIIQRAREVVAKAIDEGWAGPPFDIFSLAERLSISVVARDDIRDARTVPAKRNAFTIEFNPNRPRGRMRYSIAHEIAHTLFPDCAEMIRNRSTHEDMEGDAWQLEAMCNIAAAEFLMPMGTLEAFAGSSLTIDNLLDARKKFDVSAEALFIRVARVSNLPVAAFVASRIEKGEGVGRYRLDYMIESQGWLWRTARNRILPASTRVAECLAIGYTAKGEESWPFINDKLYLECVGIPPYPGSSYPRVVGLLKPATPEVREQSSIVYLTGNALEPRGKGVKIIAHVVNDKTPNWGGSGFSRSLRSRCPQVQDDFRHWAEVNPSLFRLGHLRLLDVGKDLRIASMICQRGYGPSPKPRLRYAALRDALERLAEVALREKASVHMPRIGSGQAGGSWGIISEMIGWQLCGKGVPVTVYDLPVPSSPMKSQADLDFSP